MTLALEADQLAAIPAGLRALKQWVCWRLVPVPGKKPTKVPYAPAGFKASHDNPNTWGTFEQVSAAAHNFDGIGFVFTAADPYCGIDLDACFTTDGTLKAWAVEVVEAAQDAGCYIERTPSGIGLHIIGRATFGHGRKVSMPDGVVETYDRLRYFTMTGEQTALGDADADMESVVGILKRRFYATAEEAIEVVIGDGLPDYQADQYTAACLQGASSDFLSFWHDKVDVQKHGADRSSHRMALVNRVAMKLWTIIGRQPTVQEVRSVCLRAPFIKHEMTAGRAKWPRLAKEECSKAIAYAATHQAGPDISAAVAAEPPKQLLYTLDDLAERAAKLRWLVKYTLPEDSIGVVFGASGAFKSFIAIDAACHIAHGMKWLGKKTRKGSVVYLAAEGGAGIVRRFQAWHRRHNKKWTDAEIHVCPVPLELMTDGPRLRAELDRLGIKPDLIVVDTMSQMFTGEENSASDVAAFLRSIGSVLRDHFHACVMVVHHSGHNAAERPRGSSAIIGNVDYMFGVHRDEKEMLAILSCPKQKDAEKLADQNFALTVHELGKDEDGDAITSLAASHIDTAAQLVEAIRRESKGGRGSNRVVFERLAVSGAGIEDVREQFYAELGALEPNAKRQAWNKCKAWAMDSGIVMVVGDRFVRKVN